MNKKKYFLLILISSFICLTTISTAIADNNTTNYNETVKIIAKSDHEVNDYLDSANISGNEYRGICVNNTLYTPRTNTSFNVSADTSVVSQRVKDIITKYYRYNNSYRTNFNIQIAIWQIIEGIRGYPIGTSEVDKMLISQMYFNQDGVENDTYTDADGTKYLFDFKYLTTNERILNQVVQDLLMFRYDIQLTPNNTTNNTPHTNNTTNNTPPNNNTTTPDNNITTPGNNTTIPDNNITDPNNNITPEIPDKKEPKEPVQSNPMKKTGVPLISLLVILLTCLSLIITKK